MWQTVIDSDLEWTIARFTRLTDGTVPSATDPTEKGPEQ
jgi:hypothetical protein